MGVCSLKVTALKQQQAHLWLQHSLYLGFYFINTYFDAGADPDGVKGGSRTKNFCKVMFYLSFDIYLCNITNVTTPYATDAVVVVANLYMITKTHN